MFIAATHLNSSQKTKLTDIYAVHLADQFGANKELNLDEELFKRSWAARAQPKLIVQDCDKCERQLLRYFADISKKKDRQRSELVDQIRDF